MGGLSWSPPRCGAGVLDRRRLVLTAVFSALLFALLPLAVWLEASYGWPWLFLGVFGLILVGYALL